jgi:prepilin-type N-terminal cleavage/methylation domain-containing protein
MQMNINKRLEARWRRAFSLVEIMVAIAVTGISFVSLYAGITAGVQVIQLSRENLRATQILVEKMETLRIKTWEQVTNGVDVPRIFTEDFYPNGTESHGIRYFGTLTVKPLELWTNYDDDMRSVTVSLTWTNARVTRVRSMNSYISRNGMQNYVF